MTDPAIGVEEEYHLVDPDTLALKRCPELARAAAGGAEAGLRAEMLSSQLESVTPPCMELAELRAELVAARRRAAAAAAGHGAVLLATSTHPSARLDEIEVLNHPRYAALVDRFGAVVSKFNLCGLHVHVSVPDPAVAVDVMRRARPYLPVLLALTGSSPFHEGVDTGYASFRTAWLALWPQGGLPPRLGSAAEYAATVAETVAAGLVPDATALLWDVRPSARYPTIEFRIADMCPAIDDALLLAAVVRSLVRTLAGRDDADPDVPDLVLRAARWRAARFGFSGELWSPLIRGLVPAATAVDELLAELRPDLEAHGEYEVVADLLAGLRERGTSAERQRRTFARAGDLQAVLRELVELSADVG